MIDGNHIPEHLVNHLRNPVFLRVTFPQSDLFKVLHGIIGHIAEQSIVNEGKLVAVGAELLPEPV